MTLLEISCGLYSASLSTHGATLLEVRHSGEAITIGPAALNPAFGHHGSVLAPWPNRLYKGKYRISGTDYTVEKNDPKYGHAIHGFAYDSQWNLLQIANDSVKFGIQLFRTHEYPFEVALAVEYRVCNEGLIVTASWENHGTRTAPFALGFHPYLKPGPGIVDEWELTVGATHFENVDPRTLKVVESGLVVGTDADFRMGRKIHAQAFSTTYCSAPSRGSTVITIADTSPRGRTLVMEADQGFPYLQIFTGDLPDPQFFRVGIAVEPQTCRIDAFNESPREVELPPAVNRTARWSLRVAGS